MHGWMDIRTVLYSSEATEGWKCVNKFQRWGAGTVLTFVNIGENDKCKEGTGRERDGTRSY